jgi:hypothetical protein
MGIALAAAVPMSTSTAAAQSTTCTVSGPAEQYNLNLNDFGRGGEPFTARDDGTYWGGTGHLIGYQRGAYDAWLSNPSGGSVFGGVVIASDVAAARNDVRSAVAGWTSDWKVVHQVEPPVDIGDDLTIVTRLTPWEIEPQQPMTEVFLAFRRCNASAQVNLLVMPKMDPVKAALHYAQILDQRLGG